MTDIRPRAILDELLRTSLTAFIERAFYKALLEPLRRFFKGQPVVLGHSGIQIDGATWKLQGYRKSLRKLQMGPPRRTGTGALGKSLR